MEEVLAWLLSNPAAAGIVMLVEMRIAIGVVLMRVKRLEGFRASQLKVNRALKKHASHPIVARLQKA